MKFLSRLFKRKEILVPFDYSIFKTDIHSHLIPGIDDGSKTMEMSMALSAGLVELGYSKAITTPHIMSDYYRNTPEIINRGLSEVKQQLKKEKIDLALEAAAEYYADFEFQELIKKKELLTIADNYVMVECSFMHEPNNLDETFFNLQTTGYKPILAHIERYPYWNGNLEFFQGLKDRGIKLQMNLLSLNGNYSPETQYWAEKLIKEGMIDFIGTDLHHEFHLEQLKELMVKPSVMEGIRSLNLLNNTL